MQTSILVNQLCKAVGIRRQTKSHETSSGDSNSRNVSGNPHPLSLMTVKEFTRILPPKYLHFDKRK